jgi:hypothetical protein
MAGLDVVEEVLDGLGRLVGLEFQLDDAVVGGELDSHDDSLMVG